MLYIKSAVFKHKLGCNLLHRYDSLAVFFVCTAALRGAGVVAYYYIVPVDYYKRVVSDKASCVHNSTACAVLGLLTDVGDFLAHFSYVADSLVELGLIAL